MISFRRLQFLPLLALAVLFVGVACRALRAADEALLPAGGELFEGQSLTLRADVEGGEGPFHYLWFKDHVPLAGATTSELRFESIRVSDAGTYWVTVFNDGGSTTSAPEILRVRSGEPSRLANVSIVGSANDRVVVGFTLGGSGTSGSTAILARAAGPALAQLGVIGALDDPVLSVFHSGEIIFANDDWGGDPLLSATASAVGAFPFLSASKDAAVVMALAGSSYSAEVVDGSSGTGTTVVELYDTTSHLNRTTPRLINIFARGTLSGENMPLTAGFTIEGTASITVLVRGLGPALEGMGVTGVVRNPKLSLFRGPTLISSNENWGDVAPAAIESARAAVGALALDAMSLDAAILVALQPGSYTAQLVSGTGGGVGRIEVYEVP